MRRPRRHLTFLGPALGAAMVLVAQPAITQAKPLPAIASLYASVLGHQEEIQNRVERYVDVCRRTTRQLDAQGKPLKVFQDESEQFLIQGVQVIRLLSRDGHPLPAEEAAAQESRLRKSLETSGKDPGPKKPRLWPTLLEILGRVEFTSVRRVAGEGQELLILDFRPRGESPGGSGSRELVSCLEGQVVVDEAALQMVRLEGHCTKDVPATLGGEKVVFGAGTSLVWEQRKLDGETWMPSRYLYRQHMIKPRDEYWEHVLDHGNYRRFEVGATRIEPLPKKPGSHDGQVMAPISPP